MFSAEDIQKLSMLASSVNAADAEIAYAIIQDQAVDKSIKTVLYLIASLSKEAETRKKAKEKLAQNFEIVGLRSCINSLSRVADEQNANSNIFVLKRFIGYNNFDSQLIAQTVYNRFKIGLEFLLESMEDLKEQEQLLKLFVKEDVCLLNKKLLSRFPDALFEFKDLVGVNLSNNEITKIPAEIRHLKKMTHLNLSGNSIVEIDEGIQELSQLKEIVLSLKSSRRNNGDFGQIKAKLETYLPNCKIL